MSKAIRKVLGWTAVWMLAAACVPQTARADDGAFSAARSGLFRLDARTGTRLAGSGAEEIALSGRWEGSTAQVSADGTLIATVPAGEADTVEWMPEGTGLHTLVHSSGGTLLVAGFSVLDGELHTGSVSGNATWSAGTVHVVEGTVTVGNGASLTIEPGAVVKFLDGGALVVSSNGVCTANGVVFTHIADDSIGGDTMGDGAASSPRADAYVISENVVMDEATDLRYLTVKTAGTISDNTVWRGGRVIHVTGNVTVAKGTTLTVRPGAVVKFDAGTSLTVNSGGILNAQGTRAQPIVFTSVKDDAHGGDTNGDGDATVPEGGDWAWLRIKGTGTFDHCSVLYASSDENYGGVEAYGGTVTFDNGEIAHMKWDSVNAHSSGTFTLRNTAIWDGSLGFGYYGSGRVKAYNCVFQGLTTAVRQSGKLLVNCVIADCVAFTDQGGDGSTFEHCVFWNPSGYGVQSYYKVGQSGNKWGNPLFVDADNGDFRLRAGSPCIDAGDGTVAPAEDYFGRPRMNDPNVEDTGVADVAGVCPDIGIYEMEGGNVSSDVDLVPVRVVAGAEVSAGGLLGVQWTVANEGTGKAVGPWRDVVELMDGDTGETVTLGEAVAGGGLDAKASRECGGSFTVPPVREGEWQVRVHVNAYRDVWEGAMGTNNAMFAIGTVSVGIPDLDEDGTASGSASAGIPFAAKVFVPDEGRWVLQVAGTQGATVRYGIGFVPAEECASGKIAIGADGTALVSLPAGTTVYVTIEGNGAVNLRLLDAAVAISGVSPAELPGSGTTTMTVRGANFEDGAVVSVGGVPAAATEWLNAETLVATVDCAALPAGACDVTVAQGEDSASLAGAVTVKRTAGKADLKAWLDVPSSVRQGRVVTIYVNYENTGNLDMPAPVLGLTATGLVFRVGGNEYTNRLNLLGLSAEAPVGTLRPGEPQRVAVEAVVAEVTETWDDWWWEWSSSVQYSLTSRWAGQEGAEKPFRMESVINERWVWRNATNELYRLILAKTGGTLAEFYANLGAYASSTLDETAGLVRYEDVASDFITYALSEAREELEKFPNISSLSKETVVKADSIPAPGCSHVGSLLNTADPLHDKAAPGSIWEYAPSCGSDGNGWWHSTEGKSYEGKRVVIIVHGHHNSVAGAGWIRTMAKQWQKHCDVVLAVDWGDDARHSTPWKTASFIPKDSATAIENLKTLKVSGTKLVLLGHSHGAHFAGRIAEYYSTHGLGVPIRLVGMDSSPVFTHPSNDRFPKAWDWKSAQRVEFFKSSKTYSMGSNNKDEVYGIPTFHVVGDSRGSFQMDAALTKQAEQHHGFSCEWVTGRAADNSSIFMTSQNSDALYQQYTGQSGKADRKYFSGVLRGDTMECGAKLQKRTAEHLGKGKDEINWRLLDENCLGRPDTLEKLRNRMALLTQYRLDSFSVEGKDGPLVNGKDANVSIAGLRNDADNLSTDYLGLIQSGADLPGLTGQNTTISPQVWAFDLSAAPTDVSTIAAKAGERGIRLAKSDIEILTKSGVQFAPLLIFDHAGFIYPEKDCPFDHKVPFNLLFGKRKAGMNAEGEPIDGGEDVLFVAVAGAERPIMRMGKDPTAWYKHDLCWDDDCFARVIKVYDGRVAPIAEVMPGEARGASWRGQRLLSKAGEFNVEQIVDDNTWTAAKDGTWTVKLTGATSHGETNIVAGMWTGFDCTVRPNTWSENPNVTVTGRLFTDETGDLEAARTYNVFLVVEDANSSTGMVEYAFTVHRPEDEPEEDKEDSDSSDVPQSWDPNEIGGPDGVKMVELGSTNRYVQAGRLMEYTIYFENQADAAAAAQEIRIVNPLSEWLDWSTFELGEVVFGGQVDLGLDGKGSGTSEAELEGNESGWRVKTVAEGAAEGRAEWYLRVVDPTTADGWPTDAYAGFLPPNDETGRGDGRVSYRIRVREDAPIGVVISNSAVITFDYNAPMETDPAWWNIVEAVTNVTLEGVSAAGTRSGDGTVEVVAGKPYGDLLPVPERTGWEFGGWFTGPDGTGAQVTAETVASADTLELFAKWVRVVFGELWLDVTHGSVVVGTNGVTAGFGLDGNAVEGIAHRYFLTGTSTVHSVRYTGGCFTNTWTNLVIDLDGKDAVPVALEGANVEVELAGDNSVAGGEDGAGIRVDAESVLVLEGTGRLEAYGGLHGAGIGGGRQQESGRIEVRSGTIDAWGGEGGAGIGGGVDAPPSAAVVITGGSVRARGNGGGEDIGAGAGREGAGGPTDGNGTPVYEVEVRSATDTVPVVVEVDLGGGKTYRYEGMGHANAKDGSLWFWLPDGTYEFEADGDDYGAYVTGEGTEAVFTDPGNTNFVAPPMGGVANEDGAMRAAVNPAYRTSPFEVWTATGLKGDAWDWTLVPEGSYVWDATNAVIRIPEGTNRLRVMRLQFQAK